MGNFTHWRINAKCFALYIAMLCPGLTLAASPQSLPANDSHLLWKGRTQALATGAVRFSYPGVSLNFNFLGHYAAIEAVSTSGNNFLSVQIDDLPEQVIRVPQQPARILLLSQDERKAHHVQITHRNETWQGQVELSRVIFAGEPLPPPQASERKLLIVGDSVTCGEAVTREPSCKKNPRWWNPQQSYGLLLGAQLNADVHLVCFGGRGLLRSWNGKTDTPMLPAIFDAAIPTDQNPIPWDHSRFQPQLVLLNLGTNDFGLNLPDTPDESRYLAEYRRFLQHIRQAYPKAEIALTEGSILNDDTPERPQKSILRSYLQKTLAATADEHVHYLASQVYRGDSCDGHPTQAQHAAMAQDLLPGIRSLTHWP